MLTRLEKLKSQITVGVVGGSDLVKQREQLGQDGKIYVVENGRLQLVLTEEICGCSDSQFRL